MQTYWGDIFASIVLGSLLYFTFEAPFILISNYFHKKRHLQDKKLNAAA
jgi:hypothetical protein